LTKSKIYSAPAQTLFAPPNEAPPPCSFRAESRKKVFFSFWKKNREWKLIPVIVLSNLGEATVVKRALEMGADDYLVKSQHPIQEVIEKVRQYIKGKEMAK